VRNEVLDDTLAILAAAGIKPIVMRNGHVKVRWNDVHGRQRTLVIGASTSDWRALLNNRATLRRLLNQSPRGRVT
jgi:hypothetical protein